MGKWILLVYLGSGQTYHCECLCVHGSSLCAIRVASKKNTDRNEIPWLPLTIHVPMYNTFALHPHDAQITKAREHVDSLLVQNHVNVVCNGHINAYQRTANVAMEKLDPSGPIYHIIGAGGCQFDVP